MHLYSLIKDNSFSSIIKAELYYQFTYTILRWNLMWLHVLVWWQMMKWTMLNQSVKNRNLQARIFQREQWFSPPKWGWRSRNPRFVYDPRIVPPTPRLHRPWRFAVHGMPPTGGIPYLPKHDNDFHRGSIT